MRNFAFLRFKSANKKKKPKKLPPKKSDRPTAAPKTKQPTGNYKSLTNSADDFHALNETSSGQNVQEDSPPQRNIYESSLTDYSSSLPSSALASKVNILSDVSKAESGPLSTGVVKRKSNLIENKLPLKVEKLQNKPVVKYLYEKSSHNTSSMESLKRPMEKTFSAETPNSDDEKSSNKALVSQIIIPETPERQASKKKLKKKAKKNKKTSSEKSESSLNSLNLESENNRVAAFSTELIDENCNLEMLNDNDNVLYNYRAIETNKSSIKIDKCLSDQFNGKADSNHATVAENESFTISASALNTKSSQVDEKFIMSESYMEPKNEDNFEKSTNSLSYKHGQSTEVCVDKFNSIVDIFIGVEPLVETKITDLKLNKIGEQKTPLKLEDIGKLFFFNFLWNKDFIIHKNSFKNHHNITIFLISFKT